MRALGQRISTLIVGLAVALGIGSVGCGGGVERQEPSTKEITAFSFTAASNPGLSGNAVAQINGDSIAVTVPAGTNVTALIATFAHNGANVVAANKQQTSGVTANDFSRPVTYRVTASDGTTRSYVVTVAVAPSDAKELTAFRFLVEDNAALGADITATINGQAIAATVPFGTNVRTLVAAFTTTGARVAVAGVAQVSGTTANDFTIARDYVVTAQDGTTRVYTVNVTIAASSAKAITAYSFRSADNAVLAADVIATINGASIALTVPFDTNVTGLIATFSTTGASVTVGGAAQVSGTTPNNFTNPVQYTVTAADQSTQVFTVTVTVAGNSAKTITAYSFLSVDNPGLGADVPAEINGTGIAATVPFGTDVTALIATFAITGVRVVVGDDLQTSGQTANDFTNPVDYRVQAADGSSQIFRVTVTVAASPAKEITEYAFLSVNNPGLAADVLAEINGTAIAATVPFGTDVTALIATFTTTGATVKVGDVVQTSGQTPNNFTNPVEYVVTAADGSTKAFTVTVTVAANPAKEITEYAFLSANNPGLAADVLAQINGTAIAATVPFGTDVTALIATFATTGATVKVGDAVQTSGQTPNNFTNPVEYVVTAADNSTKTFTVTVTVAANPAKEITEYAFLSVNNPGLAADVLAQINGTAIAATVPFGTDVTALVATFATTGATVKVGDAVQTSGQTANNFTNPVDYIVTAADDSTKTFTVTVTIAPNPAKEITEYAFLSVNNPGLAADVLAQINGTAIAATVPFGTDVTALVATFATTGATVKVGDAAQTSGQTANSFANPVEYVVTAADGSTKTFTVTVTVAPSPAKEITAYSFLSANNPGLDVDLIATINGTAIAATVPFGTDVTALIATFATTGATVTVGDVTQTSGQTANEFTNPVEYIVTAADQSTKTFTVTVSVAPDEER
jgi:hypothetical protein